MTPEVELRGLRRRYGRREVLTGLDAAFPAGEFSVVLGPPGSGKSVLLRLLVGLEQPDAGQVFVRGEDVTARPAGERHFGYVPQSFALYPHYRVFANVAYPLTLARVDRPEVGRRVGELARRLQIDHLLEKFPHQLSGGEKQRVALARGMVGDAAVFVLDDPLVGLDFKLREQLFGDLREMLSAVRGTFVYATSDPLEALALADRVFVLDGGRVVEAAPVEAAYERPAHLRSLQLLGFPAANLVPGRVAAVGAGGGFTAETALGTFPFAAEAAAAALSAGDPLVVGLRPEQLAVDPPPGPSGDPGRAALAGQETLREDLGAETLLSVQTTAGLTLRAVWFNSRGIRPADPAVRLTFSPADLRAFDPRTGRCVGQGNPAHV